jgi:hypothetical protein
VSGAALARWASIERTIADLCLCWTEATGRRHHRIANLQFRNLIP